MIDSVSQVAQKPVLLKYLRHAINEEKTKTISKSNYQK